MRTVMTMVVGIGMLATVAAVGGAWGQQMPAIEKQAAMPMMMSPPVAAILPSSRSVLVGTPATAFATMINMGSGMATGCGMAPAGQMPGTFMYQATDPNTNQPIGMPNSPMNMPMGGSQTFMFAFTPMAPMDPTDMVMNFSCTNTTSAVVHPGLNTFLVSASTTPVPDMVALAATLGNDGIVNVPGPDRTGAFAVATFNMGAAGTITASVDTGDVGLPVGLQLCQTDSGTGQCVSTVGSAVTMQVNAGMTPTFAIFVEGHGTVPFDPATNRVFVRFTDASGRVRGATSVAVRTQ
jgi:hypothetical protein